MRKTSRMKFTTRHAITGALVLSACTSFMSARAAPAEVRVGINGVISDAAFFIAERKGYFKEQDIAVKFVPFDAGPKMIAPLGAGQLDVAAGASSAGLYNASARGIDIRIVADKGSAPPHYDYMPLLVRKQLVDSGKVKSYADLKGLKVAEAGEGGSPGSTLNEALKKGGMTYKDVSHVYMGYPQHVPALANGAIDASITTEPSATQAIASGAAVRLSDDKLYPGQQIAVLLYGGDFIKKRPDVAKRFMVAYVKAARFYNDALKDGHFAGPNATELIAMLVLDTNVKDAELYRKMTPNGINPDGRVNLDSLKRDFEFYTQQGYLEGKAREPATMNAVVDQSFVEAALKTLGPYAPAAK
jgi:NitT/TauT family transport system substrate-binding protein